MRLTASSAPALLFATLWTMGCGPAQIRGADPDTGEQTRSRSSMFEMLKECSSEGMIKLNLPQRPDTPDVACYYSKLGLIAITCLGNDFEVSHLGEKTTAGDYYFDAVGPVRFAGPKQKHWVAINGPLAPKYSAGLPLVESVVVTDFSLPMCDPKATGYARKIADKCGGITGKGQCIGKTVQFCLFSFADIKPKVFQVFRRFFVHPCGSRMKSLHALGKAYG
jgi:hypothetical protein